MAIILIKSYLSERSQCVHILSEAICGVSHGSVLDPLCMYMLLIGVIMRSHDIQYHIYADDIQLYISFDLKDPSTALNKLNLPIYQARAWIICNKSKINHKNTVFYIEIFLQQN